MDFEHQISASASLPSARSAEPDSGHRKPDKEAQLRRAGRSAINESLYDELLAEIAALAQKTQSLEREVALAGEVMRIAQPPRPGKVDVRWWKVARKKLVQPVLVRWNKHRARWRAVPWSYRKAGLQRDGTSALNVEAMEAITPLVVQSIAQIKERHQQIERFIREARRVNVELAMLRGDLNATLEFHHRRIVARLVERGYTVEEKYRGDLDAMRPEWNGPDDGDIV